MKMKNQTKYIATMGLLVALALALTTLEGIFTAVLPVGIRLGLANVVVMFALLALDWKSAFTIIILKALFVFLTRGVTAFGMSLCGGILAFVIMLILYKKANSSLVLMSISGAVVHNLGQLIVAVFITGSINTLFYAPLLLIAGVAAGTCTAVVIKIVMPAILKIQH